MRQKLLDVALKLFAQSGIDAVTIRQIAAETSVSLPTVYHHFKDKIDLYREAVLSRHRAEEQVLSQRLQDVETLEDFRDWLHFMMEVSGLERDFHQIVFREVLRDDEVLISQMARNMFEPLYSQLKCKLDGFLPGLGSSTIPLLILSTALGSLALQPFRRFLSIETQGHDETTERDLLADDIFVLVKARVDQALANSQPKARGGRRPRRKQSL